MIAIGVPVREQQSAEAWLLAASLTFGGTRVQIVGTLPGFIRTAFAIFACCALLIGCSPIRGYPHDPENTDATLDRLKPYFDGTKEDEYFNPANTAEDRARIRNQIVLTRIRGYDIEFAEFERKLYGDANAVSLGSDLIGLILGGFTATTGSAAAKSALGAASIGILGANTAINRDLFYQKTVPALLAQMEADRLIAKAPIVAGLKQLDANYPLIQAYIDLDVYKNAGSIPGAINAINRDAGDAKDVALATLRTDVFVEDTSSQQLRDYLWPLGIDKPVDKPHLARVRQWMSGNLPAGVPVEALLYRPTLAAKRRLAIGDLGVP
jgi:hypothetical protein